MTEKTPPETDPEQSERFRKAVRDIEAAGGLSEGDAEVAFERVLRRRPRPDQGKAVETPDE